jgi:hypothetical protein
MMISGLFVGWLVVGLSSAFIVGLYVYDRFRRPPADR